MSEGAELARAIPRPVVIQAGRGGTAGRLREVWEYRELMAFFVWRDVKVRYKQTLLGVAWAILQPLFTALVFTLLFGRLAKMDSDGLPYLAFAYCGLLVWNFFAQGLAQAANSLVGSANLITKVYFPRVVIPASAILAGFVDLVVAFPVLVAMMLATGLRPGPAVLLTPVFVVLAALATFGSGLWLSALNVEYRDVRHIVPFLVQLWLFLSPVIYPASKVRTWLLGHGLPAWLWGLNPMTGVVEGFRWALLDAPPVPGSILLASTAMSFLLLVTGLSYFRRVERSFADVI